MNRGKSPERGVGIGVSDFGISEVLMTRGRETSHGGSPKIDLDHLSKGGYIVMRSPISGIQTSRNKRGR
jgi:hypothetical protein